MPYRTFALYNVAGAILWVGICVGAGYLFGNIPVVKENFELVVLGIVGVSVLPLVIETGPGAGRRRSRGQSRRRDRASCRRFSLGLRGGDDRAHPRRQRPHVPGAADRRAPRWQSGRGRSGRRRPAGSSARPLRITWRLPTIDSGTIGRPACTAGSRLPPLNGADAAVAAAGALGKDDQRQAARGERVAPSAKTPRGSGRLRSTSMCPVRRRCQPRNGKRPSDRLGDDAQLVRQRSRTAPGCRRCSGGWRRRRRSRRESAGRGRGPRRAPRW